ncbi:IclR family transcriptional regulator [Pseudonocardia halophobica]|uniref:IclR family transcriptional regulator n=1 Tax=Pseudonocardia halophobica TaxID=29401 RepID=A0A9W6NYY7_9PSEU|nr:IclR family transcriptional regulator [Pseudonocardia halophobica]GLL14037.1 IclR family transcriptional regulator [Pseudonocardia halophobica]
MRTTTVDIDVDRMGRTTVVSHPPDGRPVGGEDENVTEPALKAHRTVSRVTSILEHVAQQPRVPLSRLTTILDAPKSSVFALVKGLVSEGYLVEDELGYSLGPAVANLLRSEGPTLADIAQATLVELRDLFDETVMLATRVGDSLIYIASAESRQPIRYSAPLRVRRPLYPTSTGKVFLAWSTRRRRRTYLRSLIDDERTLLDAEAELEQVRREGVSYNRGETLPDVSAVARPILVRDEVVGVIAVAGPTVRMPPTLDHAPEALAQATGRLAERLS